MTIVGGYKQPLVVGKLVILCFNIKEKRLLFYYSSRDNKLGNFVWILIDSPRSNDFASILRNKRNLEGNSDYNF